MRFYFQPLCFHLYFNRVTCGLVKKFANLHPRKIFFNFYHSKVCQSPFHLLELYFVTSYFSLTWLILLYFFTLLLFDTWLLFDSRTCDTFVNTSCYIFLSFILIFTINLWTSTWRISFVLFSFPCPFFFFFFYIIFLIVIQLLVSCFLY